MSFKMMGAVALNKTLFLRNRCLSERYKYSCSIDSLTEVIRFAVAPKIGKKSIDTVHF